MIANSLATRIRPGRRAQGRARLSRIAAAVGGVILVAVASACGTADQPAAPATPAVASMTLLTAQAPFGEYLTDSAGRALYMWDADRGGTSTCYGDCATAWPPLIVGDAAEPGPGVNAALIGQVERKDGTEQVTYGGWPLYYFEADAQPGELAGQGDTGFGAVWWVVAPDGKPLPSS